MVIKNPKPMHPGRVLSEVYMSEMGLTQVALAARIGCTHRKVNEIVNEKRSITADFAIDLEKAIGASAEMWVRMQAEYDLSVARRERNSAA